LPDAGLAAGARQFEGRIDGRGMVASFSGLRRGAESDGAPWLAPGPGEPGTLHAFPAGARAGDFFHALLERWDPGDAAAEPGLVASQLRAHGFDVAWQGVVEGMLRALAEADLGEGLRLPPAEGWRREVEFWLPANDLTRERWVAKLAEVAGRLPEGFAGRMGRLAFAPVDGYLHGYIDLIFRQGGRYYVVDWKSNRIGAGDGDYTLDAMGRAMRAHDYDLQFHLYSLALDRWLRASLPGYDPGEHFGGVIYIFLRGVKGPCHGAWRAQPDLAVLEAMRGAMS
jgi:exodeoxyribonuclease V beta subunit